MQEEIETEKIWKKIFPPECFRNFWHLLCLEHLKTSRIFNAWEIFARCSHARECATLCGYNYEEIKSILELVEKNRIVNVKTAQWRAVK